MQNYVGQQIAHYRILERLGSGGMAVVYKAYDIRLERDVAVKLIRTDEIPSSQHQRLLKRFEQEAKAQARFSHPNIIPAYDFGEFDDIPYLVLAYMPGGTLKDRIQGPMSVDDALEIIIAIADAIAYAHHNGVLHRDIKPSNILFSQENVPMLTDFGIAKVLQTNEGTLTGTGLGVGTPEYMAPEQWQGKASAASDQYALGVLFYEMITGHKPYTAETPLAVAIKQINEPLQRPRHFVPNIPEDVEKIIFKTLALEPDDRFESVESLCNRLVSLKDELEDKFFESVRVEKENLKAEEAFESREPIIHPEADTRDDLDDVISTSEVTPRREFAPSVPAVAERKPDVKQTIKKKRLKENASKTRFGEVFQSPYLWLAVVILLLFSGAWISYDFVWGSNRFGGTRDEKSSFTSTFTTEPTDEVVFSDENQVADEAELLTTVTKTNTSEVALTNTQTETSTPTETMTVINTYIPPTAIPPTATRVPPTSPPKPTATNPPPPTSPPPTNPPKPTNTSAAPPTREPTPTPP